MKYDDTQKPDPVRELIAKVFATLMVGIFSLAIFGFAGLLFYGCGVLIFRHAFGIELPNPFAWFGVGRPGPLL